MKKNLTKAFALLMALSMCMCTVFSTIAFAAGESTAITPRNTALGTVVFSSANYNGNRLPESASKSIYLNQNATMALIKVLPFTPGQSGSVNVTIKASSTGTTKTVTVRTGTDQWVDLSGFLLSSRNYEVSYANTSINLSHIGVTFGR